MSTAIPPIFKGPPLETPFSDGQQTPAWSWKQWFLEIAIRLNRPVSSVAPATSAGAGSPGQIATDGTYLYIAVGTNTWKRITLVTF